MYRFVEEILERYVMAKCEATPLEIKFIQNRFPFFLKSVNVCLSQYKESAKTSTSAEPTRTPPKDGRVERKGEWWRPV